jgi:phage replication initiation protein
VDWLDVTFKVSDVALVTALFDGKGTDEGNWAALPVGHRGYKQGLLRGHVRVYFDGAEGMGVHVSCSATACRQLEAEGLVGSWEEFAGRLLAAGAEPARVDVAFDDRAGALDTSLMEASVRGGECVSRFRKSPRYEVLNLETGQEATGWSRYFGTAASRLRVRMYDKQAEQIEKGKSDPGHWVRVELQARDERAEWVLKALRGEGVSQVAGLLLGYIDFKERGEDSNRSRWKTCRWWWDFLGQVEKETCTVAKDPPTVEEVAAWIWRQVAPALALVRFAGSHGEEWIADTIAAGAARWKERHWKALAVANGET